MSTALSGITSNVFSAGTDMDSMGWTLDIEVNTFDSTTTADLGWDDETASTKKLSGSFDFLYNIAKKPTVKVAIGSTVALVLWVDNPGGDSFSGNGLIKKLSLKQKTKDGFVITASFVNKGVWTLPT